METDTSAVRDPDTAVETKSVKETEDLYNGREAEVIVQFREGVTSLSYSKDKLEASARELLSERKAVKPTRVSVVVKREDATNIVNEFDISQAQAEKVLSENGGDLEKAFRALVAN